MWGTVMRIALVIFLMTPLPYGQTSASGRLMIIVEFEVKPERRDQYIELIKALGQRSRAEDGCQQFDVMLQNNDPKHVLVVEKWRDAAAHDAHLNGPSVAKSREASKDWIVDRKVTSGICNKATL